MIDKLDRFNRIYELETKVRNKYEEEEYKILKSMETKRDIVEIEDDDDEDEYDLYEEQRQILMDYYGSPCA